jgi:hypothetical protein
MSAHPASLVDLGQKPGPPIKRTQGLPTTEKHCQHQDLEKWWPYESNMKRRSLRGPCASDSMYSITEFIPLPPDTTARLGIHA